MGERESPSTQADRRGDPVASDCRICRAIADDESCDSESDDPALPPEVKQLGYLPGAAIRLRRCPLCETYYDWFYDHDSGGGTSVGGTLESFRRLSPAETIAKIREVMHELPFEPLPPLEDDLERLLRDHPEPEFSVEASIAALDAAFASPIDPAIERAQLAAWSLGRRRVPEAMSALVRALGNRSLRAHAARALANYGAVAVPLLVERLERGEPYERMAVAAALGAIGPAAVGARSALIARIDAMSPEARDPFRELHRELGPYASALGRMGFSVESLTSLLRFFAADYVPEREAAIRAIGRMGVAAVPVLIQTLHDDERKTRHSAVLALTEIGPAASAAVPQLLVLLAATPDEERNTTVPVAIEKALSVLRGGEA
jgi:HEAT repeat protein